MKIESRPPQYDEVHFETLEKQSEHIEQEARMVLPGIQALFGFQLIAVFNAKFAELTTLEQHLHLVALGLTAIATIFTIAPAAYHRQAEPDRITREFVNYASLSLCRGMSVLALSTCLDFYLIARLVTLNRLTSGILAIALFSLFKIYWTVYPASKRTRPDTKSCS